MLALTCLEASQLLMFRAVQTTAAGFKHRMEVHTAQVEPRSRDSVIIDSRSHLLGRTCC